MLIAAAIFFFISGFFVAKFPVKPELAWVSSIFVLIMALSSYVALCKWLGIKRGVLLLASLALYAICVEYIAVKTGLPYGEFQHFDKIGYRLFDTVPWTVPFAWSPLILASYALAFRKAQSLRARLFVSALILVGIDLLLDPGTVAQKFWLYSHSGILNFPPLSWRFYDVPLSNFLGWLLSGFFASFVFWKVLPQEKRGVLPPRGLMSSAFLVVVFWMSACIWMQLWLPALVGAGLVILFIPPLFFADSS